ncbi:MAG: VanW family protein [Clostridia bacterium]|nr:VanW family protein [Clostridia bacterium]
MKPHVKTATLLFAGAFFFCPFFALKPTAKPVNAVSAENPYGWDKISSYTTYYSQKDVGRCANIAIAASLIDGVTIQPYGEFSFNSTVGRRTEEAGFQQAKIIVKGEYVLGVGGGVCQVSTTLYNAALKAGLTVTEFHPHTLRVAYVQPSRDAMVSTGSDLCFINPHAHAVRLSAKVFEGGIRVCFYGKDEGYRYEIVSSLLSEIPPPEPIIKEGDKEEILREEKSGAKSEMYLERYRGDRLLSRKRLRTDEYRPVQGIIVKKITDTTNKIGSNDCVFGEKML